MPERSDSKAPCSSDLPLWCCFQSTIVCICISVFKLAPWTYSYLSHGHVDAFRDRPQRAPRFHHIPRSVDANHQGQPMPLKAIEVGPLPWSGGPLRTKRRPPSPVPSVAPPKQVNFRSLESFPICPARSRNIVFLQEIHFTVGGTSFSHLSSDFPLHFHEIVSPELLLR